MGERGDNGSGWESNPQSPALSSRPPVLKTGAPTGTQPLPFCAADYTPHPTRVHGLDGQNPCLMPLCAIGLWMRKARRFGLQVRHLFDHLDGLRVIFWRGGGQSQTA